MKYGELSRDCWLLPASAGFCLGLFLESEDGSDT
jgi:hypothetical protein